MKNIVWLVSYPKSGNTWFRMFLANYLGNTMQPIPLEEIESANISSDAIEFEEIIGLNPFELTPDEVDLFRPDWYRIQSMRVESAGVTCFKKTHDAYIINGNGEPIFPEEVSRCAIYFVRNPMDVCVSYANHSAGDINKKLCLLLKEEAFVAGSRRGQLRQKLLSWGSHIKSWQSQTLIPMQIVRYEDMLRDPFVAFGSILTFLGLEYDEKRLGRAILNSDFKLLQQMEQENGFREKMQKCKNFFWKGKIGNYREYLSEDQIKRIVEYNCDTMKQFGYIDNQGLLTV